MCQKRLGKRMLFENLEDGVPSQLQVTKPSDCEAFLGFDPAAASRIWRRRLQDLEMT